MAKRFLSQTAKTAAEWTQPIQQPAHDLSFLYSRGYLEDDETGFRLSAKAIPKTVYQGALRLPEVTVIDYFSRVAEVLECKVRRPSRQHIFEASVPPQPQGPHGSWVANLFQVEIGFRLVPVTLSLATHCNLRDLYRESSIREIVPNIPYELENLLLNAGMISKLGHVTQFGERVFQRGTGPFGIIYSYRPYLNQLTNRLQGKPTAATICRDENVLASQRANRKWLQAANDCLDFFANNLIGSTEYLSSMRLERGRPRDKDTNATGKRRFGMSVQILIQRFQSKRLKLKRPENFPLIFSF